MVPFGRPAGKTSFEGGGSLAGPVQMAVVDVARMAVLMFITVIYVFCIDVNIGVTKIRSKVACSASHASGKI